MVSLVIRHKLPILDLKSGCDPLATDFLETFLKGGYFA